MDDYIESLVQQARETDNPGTIVDLHEKAKAHGGGDEFALRLAEDAADTDEGVEVTDAKIGDSKARAELVKDSDSITEWLRTVPWVGKHLVKGRGKLDFLRYEDDDTTGIRRVKLLGKGVAIILTGTSGYVMVAEGKPVPGDGSAAG